MSRQIESDQDVGKQVGLTNAQHDFASSVDPELLAQGLELIQAEKMMPLRETFRHHWRALLWGMVLSFALVMDGYDGSVTLSFFALPSFKNQFGTMDPKTHKMGIPANWQAALQNVGVPGGFLGLAICGYCQERFGSRKTYMGGMILVICVVFLFVFVQSLGMLLGAQAIAAMAWAIFNTLSASYAAEICPIQLRGIAISFISMCWGMGSFIASGVNRGALAIEGSWGWRMAYCVQWVWPVPLLIFAFFAPESPWWLVRHGREEDAKKTLIRTAAPGYWDTRNIDAYIAVIRHTDEIERAETAGASFWDLWRGTNRRRTEIQMGLWACQVWSGTAMTAYAVEFFKDAGMTTVAAFNLNIVVTSMNLVGCMIEMALVPRFGRRPMILSGLMILALMLLLIGIFGFLERTKAVLSALGACCAIINLVYHASIGPLTYTVAAEVPSTRLRVKSVAWGRAFYAINYNSTSQLTPRMVSENAWNWGPKAALFWLGGNLGVTIWAFFRLPETKGRSYPELDILFANKVAARKFSKTIVTDEAAATETKMETVDDKDAVEHVEQRPMAVLT